jgi:S1-C subfamily serine protease
MMRRTIALVACMILCGISVLSHAAEISGAWKIDTRDWFRPLCNLVQVGNKLNGSCVVFRAAGVVTGTVVGPDVRWRWHLGAYAFNAAAVLDFTGTLQPDNSITGVIEQRAFGVSLNRNFTATRQFVTGRAQQPAQGQRPQPSRYMDGTPMPSQEELRRRAMQNPDEAGQTGPKPKEADVQRSFGTAFFVSGDGTALTNAHVVEHCREVRVGVGRQEVTARIIARDGKNDLALLATSPDSSSQCIIE